MIIIRVIPKRLVVCYVYLLFRINFAGFFNPIWTGGGGGAYQAFYGLEHYNLLETGSFLIRKLNQATGCLMLQSKGKIHLNHHLIAISSEK